MCIACQIISNQIRVLVDEISHLSAEPLSIAEMSTRLNTFQRCHDQFRHSIDLLNQIFGSLLCFEFLFIFVGFINAAMSIIIHHRSANPSYWTLNGIILADHFIRLLCTCLSAENIFKQVSILNRLLISKLLNLFLPLQHVNLKLALHRLSTLQPDLKQQVNIQHHLHLN